jgi:primary-amine oxidase
MSTAQVSWTSPTPLAHQAPNHPLSPLTALEISTSSKLVHRLYPPRTNLHFKAVTLQEPEKAQALPYLEAEQVGTEPSSVDRRSFVCYYIRHAVSIQADELPVRPSWFADRVSSRISCTKPW